MDEIQRILVKVGRRDLAQKYYLKMAALKRETKNFVTSSKENLLKVLNSSSGIRWKKENNLIKTKIFNDYEIEKGFKKSKIKILDKKDDIKRDITATYFTIEFEGAHYKVKVLPANVPYTKGATVIEEMKTVASKLKGILKVVKDKKVKDVILNQVK